MPFNLADFVHWIKDANEKQNDNPIKTSSIFYAYVANRMQHAYIYIYIYNYNLQNNGCSNLIA